MTKKLIHATVDEEVWYAFQSQVPDRLRSSTINNLLREFITTKQDDAEESEIKMELDKLNDDQKVLTERRAALSAQLAMIRARQERESREAEERARETRDFIDELGIMRNNGVEDDR